MGTSLQQVRFNYDEQTHAVTITLDRPGRRNAFTSQMLSEFLECLDRADAMPEVRSVIVTGAGDYFCAGAELGESSAPFEVSDVTGAGDPSHRDEGGILALRLFEMTKPTIAAINGPAVGIGLAMTLAMDFRIVGRTAKLGFPYSRRGIVPEGCSSWFLSRLVGMATALDWILTGRVFDAEEAFEAGLVSRLVDPGTAAVVAGDLAGQLSRETSAVSCALVRSMLWVGQAFPHPRHAHERESLAMSYVGGRDALEGVAAFLEKRPTAFRSSVPPDLPPWFTFEEPSASTNDSERKRYDR